MFKPRYFFTLLCSLLLLISFSYLTSVSAQICTDNDLDGYGNPGDASCPKGNKTDCNDNDNKVYPGAAEICDGKDTNCDGWKPPTDVDTDGDGVPKCKNDCDDNNPNRYPGKAEICDGIDNDCNYVVPTNEKDNDLDGYRPCDVSGDCKDNDANVNPGLNETGTAMCSDAKDNDCDGMIDNNDPPCQTCTDSDGDGYGNPGSTFCTAGSAADCNDADIDISPAAVEICDGTDNNCSGTIDEGFDADGDGFTSCNGDCNDDSATIKPNAVEVCNGTDENCNGTIDEGFDADGDGYRTCQGDCDDARAGVNPGAIEIPYNGLNDDCNPLTKDDDLDGDSYPIATDCNDSNANIHPAATDIPYDGIDQDCSGADFADVDGDGYNSSVVAGGTDCDDNNAALNPAAADAVCNGADENCNGTNDEQYAATATNCGAGQCATTGLLECQLGVLVDNCTPLAPGVEGPANDPTCYDGLDNNCDGLTDDPNDPNCITVCEDKDGDGVGVGADCAGQTDCNDNNAAVRPGAVEVCNGIDDNCNGTTDEGFDADADGYTTCNGDCNDNSAGINPAAAEIPYDGIDQNCSGSDLGDVDSDGYNSTAVAGGTDCNDNNVNINPAAAEIPYDGIDQNCSGADLTDVDSDGYNSTAVAGGTDCNDNSAAINPGAAEVCNSRDDNCNGSTDEGFDADGDNYKTCAGDCDDTNPSAYPGAFEQCDGKDNNCDGTNDVDADHDGYPVCNPLECNDNDASVNPGAAEVCNSKDDNCNGSTDEGFDADGDTYATCNGDCDDTNANVKPGAVEICDGKDTNCDGWKPPTDVDKDGDGVPVCASDCDDNDPNRYPGKAEACDGIDNDCNSVVPTNEKDNDLDGYRPCDVPGDCDNNNAAINPGVAEVGALCIDNKDNDCDGLTDVNDLGCAAFCADNDSDGYGNPGNANCTNGAAQDCNDSNANINPGKAEICNDLDENCNGTIDEGYDADGDGYKTCTGDCNDNSAAVNPGRAETPYNAIDDDCNPATRDDDLDADGYPAATECNDSNAGINPGAVEIPYDGIDQNCSGADLTDVDGDGYNSTAVAGGTDCNDNSTAIRPGAVEICNGADENCNGTIDDGFDADSDGVTSCAGDCDDNNAAIKPGASDSVCDGVDNNCSGTPDEDYTSTPTTCGTGVCAAAGQLVCQAGEVVDTCTDGAPQTEGPAGNATCADGLDNDCDGLTDNPADGNCVNACVDTDNDGYGTPGHQDCTNGIAHDCDNNNAAIYPGAVEVCNVKDDNCDGTTDEGFDADGDNYTSCGGDCNDGNAGINPAASEIPYDGIDQNCSGADLTDVDGDGYYSTAVAGGTDCNDNNANINPGKTDIPYDGIDQNCSGADLTDVDGDGYNYTAVAGGTDCNDNNANINPGKAETCNSIDDNCNSIADEGFNADGDSYTTCGGDCDDTMAGTYPGAFELCDGRDNNCDGTSDVDADLDGYPACDPQECNDNNANVNPGRAETCNSIDDNCNGSIDDGFDADGDTYTTCGGDCDDTDPKVKPGAAEICDGKDSNCDGWKSPTDRDNDHDGVALCASDCNDNDPARYPGNCEICNDLIDNDCDNAVDASDTECRFSCVTKTNQKNGPHMFTLLDPATGNSIMTACNWCHFDGTGAIDQRTQCQRCHTNPADTSDPLNGTLKQQYPLAPPYGFGTAVNVKQHSSSVLGSKYGSWGMSCINCHNPHSQEQDIRCGNNNDYGMLIREYICYDNAATGEHLEETIQFTSDSGSGSFADGAPYERNICEMCHTQTNHHQNNGLAPGDLDAGNSYIGHYDGYTCTSCHSHAEGFKPGCGGCHEVPPPTGTHLKHFGGAADSAAYGSTGITQDAGPQGTVYLMNCGNCHPMDIANHNNNTPNSGGGSAEIELYNPNAPAGSLKALNPPDASYTPGTTVYTDSKGLQYTNGTCANVYCHSNPVFSTSGQVPSPQNLYPPLIYNPPWESLVVQSREYMNPVWGVDSLGCDGCHGYPILNQYPAVSAGAGDSHAWNDEYGYINLHVWNMGYDPLQCNTCHYDTVRDDATWLRDEYSIVFGNISIFNTSKHVNGSKDINFTPYPVLYPTSSGNVYHDLSGAGFDSGTKTCSNVSCHQSQTEVKWGSPYRWWNSSECNVCHQY